jgi:hypothetical protein
VLADFFTFLLGVIRVDPRPAPEFPFEMRLRTSKKGVSTVYYLRKSDGKFASHAEVQAHL